MAKKSAAAKSNVIQLRPAAAQKPIIIRERVQSAPTKKTGGKKGHKGGGASKSTVQDAMIGAGALGFLENSTFGAMIPSLPVGGKAATVGIGLYLIGGKYKKYATGPLAVATYNAVKGMNQNAVQGWAQPGVAAAM